MGPEYLQGQKLQNSWGDSLFVQAEFPLLPLKNSLEPVFVSTWSFWASFLPLLPYPISYLVCIVVSRYFCCKSVRKQVLSLRAMFETCKITLIQKRKYFTEISGRYVFWKTTLKKNLSYETKQNKKESEKKSVYHLFILINVLKVDFKKYSQILYCNSLKEEGGMPINKSMLIM